MVLLYSYYHFSNKYKVVIKIVIGSNLPIFTSTVLVQKKKSEKNENFTSF